MSDPRHPHAVHAPPVSEIELVRTYDPARFGLGDDEPAGEDGGGLFWTVERETRRDGLDACPDCGRGLQAGADPDFPYLVCPYLTALIPVDDGVLTMTLGAGDRPCHEDCVVACGVIA